MKNIWNEVRSFCIYIQHTCRIENFEHAFIAIVSGTRNFWKFPWRISFWTKYKELKFNDIPNNTLTLQKNCVLLISKQGDPTAKRNATINTTVAKKETHSITLRAIKTTASAKIMIRFWVDDFHFLMSYLIFKVLSYFGISYTIFFVCKLEFIIYSNLLCK